MNKFTAKDGTATSALSIVQRMCSPLLLSFLFGPPFLNADVWIVYCGLCGGGADGGAEKLEVLNKRDPRGEGQE